MDVVLRDGDVPARGLWRLPGFYAVASSLLDGTSEAKSGLQSVRSTYLPRRMMAADLTERWFLRLAPPFALVGVLVIAVTTTLTLVHIAGALVAFGVFAALPAWIIGESRGEDGHLRSRARDDAGGNLNR